MNLTQKILIVALLSLLTILSGCKQQNEHNKAYFYFAHPDQLKSAYLHCKAELSNSVDSSRPQASPFCQQVFTVAQQFSMYTQAFIQNQQAFGQKILTLQESIFQNQTALRQAKKTDNTQDITQLTQHIKQDQLEVDKLRAIVRLFVSP